MDIGFDEFLTSLFSLTLGAIIGSEVQRIFYRPRVIVRYKDINPLHDESGIYWSLKIENYGRTVAKDCAAVVTLHNIRVEDILSPEDIDSNESLPEYKNESIDLEIPRKQIISSKHFRPIGRASLCWSKLGNPDLIDINPGISQLLDLCKFQKSEKGGYFIFPSEEGWRRVRVRLFPKTYKGHILICPANEFPVKVKFELKVNSNGNSHLSAVKPNFFYRFKRNRYD